jgi:hypothetical protein
MSLPPAYLSQKLTQPLPTKAGGVLRTIRCTADHMLAMLRSTLRVATAGAAPPNSYSTNG